MKFNTFQLFFVKRFLIFSVCCVVVTHDVRCLSLSCLVFADSSPSHSSVTSHSLPPAFPDDDDEFSDFVQGPVDASSSFPSSSLPPSSPSLRAAHVNQPLEMCPGQHPPSSPLPHTVPSSLSVSPVIQHSSVISSSQSAFQGNAPLTISFYHTITC